MKRVFAFILSVILAFSLTACGTSSKVTSSGSTTTTSGSSVKKHSIGIIFYGKDDAMGSAVYSYLNYAAKALDCNITWTFGNYDAASQLTTCQNMVAAGCEGILMMPMDTSATQQVASYCQQKGVYFGLMFRDITDATVKKQVEAMDHYVVDGFENDTKYAQRMVEYMHTIYKVSNFGFETIATSSPLATRNTGFANGIKSTGINKLAEFAYPSDCDTQQVATGIENFVNSYPKMDAIALGNASVGAGETCVNTLKTLNKSGKIKVGCFDTFEGMENAFKSGTLVYACGGMGVESLFDFIVLYNAVDGTPLSRTFSVLNLEEIEVKSVADCEAYTNYIDNPKYQIFDAKTIQNLVKRFNSKAALADVQKYMNNYSLDYVVKNAH